MNNIDTNSSTGKASAQRCLTQHTGTNGYSRWWTARRILLGVWFFQGVLPLILQARIYVNFVTPHKVSANLVVPRDLQKETANLTEVCPAQAFVLAGIWWNLEPTHYFKAEQGIICHSVVPQYNLHGNYFIGNSKTTPFYTTPANCVNDSYPFEVYLYHGSIGYYSFYQGEVGTYCTSSKTAYITMKVLGTFDINGSSLAEDRGSTEFRFSYWYGTVGAIWLVYRILIISRSFVSCKSYGRKCGQVGVQLNQQQAIVFVQENLRLSAHGASNYQRSALLYMIIEGVMMDLFLIIANDGWVSRIQYISLGYNLSGLMLLLFEMLESMKWLSEKWRMLIKRLFFSYETILVGELVSALAFQSFLSGLNGSELKHSKPTALAVSYYLWSLVCHGIVVVIVLLIISSVRVPWAVMYVWMKHRSLSLLVTTCSIDAALGARSRIILLGGYLLENDKLYYKRSTLKAFGLLKMKENGVEYLVMHKLQWFTVPRDDLVGIGVILGQLVKPCKDQICTGIARFSDERLGGVSSQETGVATRTFPNRVMDWPGPSVDIIPPSPTESLIPMKLSSDVV